MFSRKQIGSGKTVAAKPAVAAKGLESLENRQMLSASGLQVGATGTEPKNAQAPAAIDFSAAPAAVQSGLTQLASSDGLTAPAATQPVKLGNRGGIESFSVTESGTGISSRLTVDQNGKAVTKATRVKTTWDTFNGTAANSAAATEITAIAASLSLTAPTAATPVTAVTTSAGSTDFVVTLAPSDPNGGMSLSRHGASGVTISVDALGNPVGNQRLPFSVIPTAIQTALNSNVPTGATTPTVNVPTVAPAITDSSSVTTPTTTTTSVAPTTPDTSPSSVTTPTATTPSAAATMTDTDHSSPTTPTATAPSVAPTTPDTSPSSVTTPTATTPSIAPTVSGAAPTVTPNVIATAPSTVTTPAVIAPSVAPNVIATAPTSAAALTDTSVVNVHTVDGTTFYSATVNSPGITSTITVNAAGALASLPTHTTTTFGTLSTPAQTELQTLVAQNGATTTIDPSQTIAVFTQANGTGLYTLNASVTSTDAKGATQTSKMVFTVDAEGNPTALPREFGFSRKNRGESGGRHESNDSGKSNLTGSFTPSTSFADLGAKAAVKDPVL